MRKALFFAMLLAALLAAGCAPAAVDAPIDVTATPAAQDTSAPNALPSSGNAAMREETLYFPEDAAEADAQYKLTYTMPVFGVESMDAAVDMYIDELYTRVTTERLPLADRAEGEALPETAVSCVVQPCEMPDGAYTNVIFSETATFGEEAEHSIYTIVLTPDGADASLAAISGVYSPEALVAQQVWNIIATDPAAYFGDVTLDSIIAALDLYNGFTVADEGYTVYLPAGAVADESAGMREFSFARSALYPGFVGDVIQAEDYEAVLPLLNEAAADALRDTFGIDLAPAPAATDGAPAAPTQEHAPAPVLLQCEDAYASNGGVTITGSLMSGAPDNPEAVPIAIVTAVLQKSAGAWAVTAFDVM